MNYKYTSVSVHRVTDYIKTYLHPGQQLLLEPQMYKASIPPGPGMEAMQASARLDLDTVEVAIHVHSAWVSWVQLCRCLGSFSVCVWCPSLSVSGVLLLVLAGCALGMCIGSLIHISTSIVLFLIDYTRLICSYTHTHFSTNVRSQWSH